MDLPKEIQDLNISAILPAGGTGERIGIKPPKQFYMIHGKPLLCYSIEAFESISWVNAIVVVVAADDLEQTNKICESYTKVRIVIGGITRHRSIAAGIKSLNKNAPDIVIIHDAVRPLVPLDILNQVVYAAAEAKAAGPICPLTSTVISKNDRGFLDEALDRSKYYCSEMPQAFNYCTIKEAYDKCSAYDLDFGTECLHLVDKYCNVKAKLVTGSPDLWKVTYKKDFYCAEVALRSKPICTVNFEGLSVERTQQIISKLESQIEIWPYNSHECQSPNLIIFHTNCRLTENFKCCTPSSYKTPPKKTVQILCNEKLEAEILNLYDITRNITNTEVTFAVWKRTKDWSDKTIVLLSNLLIELLSTSSQVFRNQIFVV